MLEGILSYIGLGSNLGDPLSQCRQALDKLSSASGIRLEQVSSFYKTEPVILHAADSVQLEELEHQNWFVNAAAEIRTELAPRDLLRVLLNIEMTMGRVRTIPGGPRVIDLDLLLYGQEIVREEGLMIPHPRMHQRLFVLEPLCEIASYLIHPVFGVSMRGLKDRLADQKIVERCHLS